MQANPQLSALLSVDKSCLFHILFVTIKEALSKTDFIIFGVLNILYEKHKF